MPKKIIMQNQPISAIRLLRVTTSHPLTIALLCEDDQVHHLRLCPKRERSRRFANAWLSGFTATAVGLPLSANRIIRLSKTVVQELPEVEKTTLDIEIGESWLSDLVLRPQNGSLQAFSFMPQCLVREVTNRRDFLGMYLFDIWAQRSGARKVIFARRGIQSIRATFINDGDCFSEHDTNCSGNNSYLCSQTRLLYQDLWTRSAVSSWIADFRKAIPSALDRSFSSLPAIWALENESATFNLLIERLNTLSDRLGAYQLGDNGLLNEVQIPTAPASTGPRIFQS